MIRTLVFDLDGVLVHPWRFREYLDQEHGITAEMTAPFFSGPFEECFLGRCELRTILPPFLDSWHWHGTVADFIDIWFSVENAPNAPVLGLVEAVRRSGIPCYLATIQEKLRARYIAEVMQFNSLFDGLFFSCDLGLQKPDVEFFNTVASRIGAHPGSILFFDDKEENVEGARTAHWNAELFVDVGKLKADLDRHLGKVV
jgi:HAD superfamily hydrolase (TIGR01509 family)